MGGSPHELVSDGARPNNVDVLYGFKLAGRTVDLAVAGVCTEQVKGAKVWTIDAAKRALLNVTDGYPIQMFGGQASSGVCGYRSARTGQLYFFVTGKGQVEQYSLQVAGGGKIKGSTPGKTSPERNC